MNPVRLYGDPFGEDAAARALRGLLRVAVGNGFDAGVALPPDLEDATTAAVAGVAIADPPSVGAAIFDTPAVGAATAGTLPVGTTVELGDGVRRITVATALPPAEIDMIRRALEQPLPATAPVVVFAAPGARESRCREAALQWPSSCKRICGGDHSAVDLLTRLRAELRWAGTEDPGYGGDHVALRPWFAVGGPDPHGFVLHVGSDDPAAGSDVAVRVFAQRFAGERRLRVVLPRGASAAAAALRRLAREVAPRGCDVEAAIEFVLEPFGPAHARGAAAVLQPLRLLDDPDLLTRLLATGIPVAATRYAATAPLLAPGAALPIGGRMLDAEAEAPACCEPDPRSVAFALRSALEDAGRAAATGRRAVAHVVAELMAERPAAPPPRPRAVPAPAGATPAHPAAAPRTDRPVVVLEAPFFEVSSASELSIDTARALLRRDNVELRLVPRTPFRHGLRTFAARWPELAARLDPAAARARDVDLWLAAGWPPRASRPACRTFALRIDQEYGSLPLELCPLVPQEADVVVVHGEHVRRTVAAAGVPSQRTAVIPHGVDANAFHEHADPLPEVLAHKGGLPAVLFAGGLVFRKGIDVFLRAVLAAHAAGRRFAVVVKAVGSDQHYAGFHLGELVDRVRRTAGAPPVLVIDRDLSRPEMAGLYRACDLLLHPYRGEGFGLPVLEARACGLPVLVTAGGATDDFTAGPGVVRLPAAPRAIDLPAPCLAQPWLLEPDAVAAGERLATALDGLEELRLGAMRMAPVVREQFSWDAAATSIERLASLATGRRAVSPRVLRDATVVALKS